MTRVSCTSTSPQTTPSPGTPRADVTLAVNHVEISNDIPGSDLRCPASFADGDVWVDASGTVSDSASGVSAHGAACIDLTAHAFTVSASEDGSFGPPTWASACPARTSPSPGTSPREPSARRSAQR